MGLLIACAGSDHAPLATPERQRPAGISIDLPSHVPTVTAGAGRQRVMSLAQPTPRARALALLNEYFTAVAREDVATLTSLFTIDAEMIVARGSKARPIDHWTRRAERLDYTTLFPQLIYSPATVDVRAADSGSDDSAASRSLLLRPGELMARVPISPTLGNSKLFGKLIEVVLSDATGEYKIRVLREDFELPESQR
jgi:ketosteroid isomerase-like protein